MSKLFGFPGGVHIPANKSQSNPGVLVHLSIPQTLVVPLGQGISKPANPCVQINDHVLKGQLIAKAHDAISANVHAPTSGTITAIADHSVPHPSGLDALCISITTDGLDIWHADCTGHANPNNHTNNLASEQTLVDPTAYSIEQIRQSIQTAGIIGMGGAGFPTAVKTHDNTVIDTLIINGVECEPYIAADDTLMQVYTAPCIIGIQLAQRLLDVRRCVIAIEDDKPDAIACVQTYLESSQANLNLPPIELIVIPAKYPSGGEKQLIENITGQHVPAQGLPKDLGIVCINVATAKAVHDAVVLGRPCIDRIVTLTGDACSQPANYEVLIGTPIADILQHANASSAHVAAIPNSNDNIITTTSNGKIIMGGPMMGFELPHADIPIIKTSNCVLLPKAAQLTTDQSMACIRCGQCEVACPANLLPQQLYWYAKSDAYEKLKEYNLFDCIECGACAYVCPSQIPLVQHYRYAKGSIRTIEHESRLAEYARIRFESREQRLADEKAAKQQKRMERAAAAAAAQAAKRQVGEEDPIAAAQARLAAKKAQAHTQDRTQNSTSIDTDPSTAAQGSTARETQIKALKTALAISRTKLKKAEQARQNAQDPADVAKFELMVPELQTKFNTAQQALVQAQTAEQTQVETHDDGKSKD